MVYLDNIVTSVFQIHIECDTEATYCFSKSARCHDWTGGVLILLSINQQDEQDKK